MEVIELDKIDKAEYRNRWDRMVFVKIPEGMTHIEAEQLSQALTELDLNYGFIIIPENIKFISKEEVKEFIKELVEIFD